MTEYNRTNNTTAPALFKVNLVPPQILLEVTLQQPDQQIAQLAACEREPLSRAGIAARSASAPTASERRRWQVIGLLLDRVPLDEIVAATGYRLRTIREIAQRYHESGAGALADRRAQSPGAPRLLGSSIQHELRQVLRSPPPGGGDWTGPKVAQWIADKTGKRVHRQRGWEYLRRLRATHRGDDELEGSA